MVAVVLADEIPGERTFGAIFHDEDGPGLGRGPPHRPADRPDRRRDPRGAPGRQGRRSGSRSNRCRPSSRSEPPSPPVSFLGPTRRIGRGDSAARPWRDPPRSTRASFGSAARSISTWSPRLPGRSRARMDRSSSSPRPRTPARSRASWPWSWAWHHCQVVCECRRMGGGFGGKESQAAHPAVMVALVAAKTGRSARIVYARDQDMRVTGKRHPYLARYRVGFDGRRDHHRAGDGPVLRRRLRLRPFARGDGTVDAPLGQRLLPPRRGRSGGRSAGPTFPPTPLSEASADPQGIAAIESVIEEVATILGLDPLDVRLRGTSTAVRAATSPRMARSSPASIPCPRWSRPWPGRRTTGAVARPWRPSMPRREPTSKGWPWSRSSSGSRSPGGR